jgi:hypothetical protein
MATNKAAARTAQSSRAGTVNVRSAVNGMEIPLPKDVAPKLKALYSTAGGNELIFERSALARGPSAARASKMKIGTLDEGQQVDVSQLA